MNKVHGITLGEVLDKINLDYYDKEIKQLNDNILLGVDEYGNNLDSTSLSFCERLIKINIENKEKYSRFVSEFRKYKNELDNLIEELVFLEFIKKNICIFLYSDELRENIEKNVYDINKKIVRKKKEKIKLIKKSDDILQKKIGNMYISLYDDITVLDALYKCSNIKTDSSFVLNWFQNKYDNFLKSFNKKEQVLLLLSNDIIALKNIINDRDKCITVSRYTDIKFSSGINLISRDEYKKYHNLVLLQSKNLKVFKDLGYDLLMEKYTRYLNLYIEYVYIEKIINCIGHNNVTLNIDGLLKQLDVELRQLEYDINQYGNINEIEVSIELVSLYNEYLELEKEMKKMELSKINNNVNEINNRMQYIVFRIKEIIEIYPQLNKPEYLNIGSSMMHYMTKSSLNVGNSLYDDKAMEDDSELIHKKIQNEVRKLPLLKMLTKEQEKVRVSCYAEYLEKKYLGKIGQNESFLSYIVNNYGELKWLVLAETRRKKNLDRVYKEYIKYCAVNGGKKSVMNFSSFVNKNYSYTADEIISIYNGAEKNERGITL